LIDLAGIGTVADRTKSNVQVECALCGGELGAAKRQEQQW
jgi:hypothetical protein